MPVLHQIVVGGKPNVVYDTHRYLKHDFGFEPTKAGYIKRTCEHDIAWDKNTPIAVGEWSLAVRSDVEKTPEFDVSVPANREWYRKWWASQVTQYEKQIGWVFWSWKTELGEDWRWSYKAAVEVGVIPKDPGVAKGITECPARKGGRGEE